MKNSRKAIVTIVLLCLMIAYLSQCMRSGLPPDKRGQAFAPEQTCRQCHQAIVDSAMLTAHHNASVAASKSNIPGNFAEGSNLFIYDSLNRVVMEKRDSGLYQVWYEGNKEKLAHRFDVGFGYSHALTWLFWQDDHAYELPLSWYKAEQSWGTSPGFPASQPYFNRLIGVDCFECHSSNINHKKNSAAAGDYFASAEQAEMLDKTSLVYGINCQRCHGPAAEHVAFREQHPGDSSASHMLRMASMSRQQQLDACALCHSGNSQPKLKSRFGFRPGDALANFFLPGGDATADVHGNQLGLLQQSKCFLQGNSVTCNTCHSPHNNASDNLATWSQKCMGCHSPTGSNFCTVKNHDMQLLQSNCIDCHMPRQASKAINYQLAGQPAPLAYRLRTHKIAVY